MLCSRCGEVVKPVVALDIDGTLGDYHGHFWSFAELYLNEYRAYAYRGVGKFRDYTCNEFGISLETWYDIKLAYRQGAQKRSMPVEPWASELSKEIRLAGCELWLTTTRPYLRLDGIDPDTRFWLDIHDIEYDKLLYDQDKYAMLAHQIDPHRVIAVIDDLAFNLDYAEMMFGPEVCFLMAGGHNRWHQDNYAQRDRLVKDANDVLIRVLNNQAVWEQNFVH